MYVCHTRMIKPLAAFPHLKLDWPYNFPSTQSIWLFQRHSGVALTSFWKGGVDSWVFFCQQSGWVLGLLLQTSVCVTVASGWRSGLAGRRNCPGSAKKLTVKSCATTAEVFTHQSSSDPLFPFFTCLSACLTVYIWGFLINCIGRIHDTKILSNICVWSKLHHMLLCA